MAGAASGARRADVPAPGAVLGLIAARGRLPLDIARAARRAGLRVAAVGMRGVTDARLEGEVSRLDWIQLGELEALIGALRAAGAESAVMAGKVPKTTLYGDGTPVSIDALMRDTLAGLADLRDDSVLAAIAGALGARGIALRPQAELVPELLAGAGTLGAVEASPAQRADAAFGLEMAKAIGRLDIGQTVVVKDRAVLAVEAIEGTDAAIRRGCALAGEGATVVKVAKPSQDPRFDMPVIGLDTLSALAEGCAGLLAVEAGHTLVLDRAELVREADRSGIALLGIGADAAAGAGS